MIYDDLSVSIWLSIGKKVHSIQMMNPGLFLQVIPVGIEAEFLCKTRIIFLYLFLPRRLTSHLWISHGFADNSWSSCHGPTAFSMNYKMTSQAYQWMTDWICMAWGQRGVRAQWLPRSVNPRTENTSVTRGRPLHQHNVWQHLRQMLHWDIMLTFTPFNWETHVQCRKSLKKKYWNQLRSDRKKRTEQTVPVFIILKTVHINFSYLLTLPMLQYHWT